MELGTCAAPHAKEATLITLVGDDEANKMSFFTLLTHYLSIEGEATVEDEIPTWLSEHFLGKEL